MDKTYENAIKQLAAQDDEAWKNGDAAKMASYWTQSGLNINPMGDVFEECSAIEEDLARNLNGFMRGSLHELKVDRAVSRVP